MPNLEWAGKAEAVQAAKGAPYRLLVADERLSYGDLSLGNAIVQGDNLDALKSLLPYYAGRVRCVYIDPPYNTHSAFEHYDDSVEHSTWLSLMYPRLELLRDFLSEDGSIWVNLDDNEMFYCKILLDEIFGQNNFVANIVWQKRTSPDARINLGGAQDYILVYSKSNINLHKRLNKISPSQERRESYKNPDNDPRGDWASVDLTGQIGHATDGQFYEIELPDGRKLKPPDGRCWAISEENFKELIADNRIWLGSNGNSRPRKKKFLSEADGVTVWTWWTNEEVGHNQEAKKEINTLFGADNAFDTPKPERLIQRILQLSTNPGDLVLDSFLGSGTTAAVAQKMGRQYIGVEIGEHATTHVVPRMKKVIDGEAGGISKEENWTGGGGFVFYRLGEALFDEDGSLQKGAPFSALAAHIWHAETDTAFLGDEETTATGIVNEARPIYGHVGENSLLGVHKGVAYYLLYNGVLGDKRPHGGNVLTRKVLQMLPPFDGPKIIFGESCRIQDEGLKKMKITFRQTPSAVKR